MPDLFDGDVWRQRRGAFAVINLERLQRVALLDPPRALTTTARIDARDN
jgi:hypothetical protein